MTMHQAHAPSNAKRICPKQSAEQMHVRTDGTNEELLTLGTSSYVEQRAQGGCKNQSHLGSKTIATAAPMADFVTPALVCWLVIACAYALAYAVGVARCSGLWTEGFEGFDVRH